MATQSVALSIPQVKFFNGNWSGWYSLGNGQDGYAGGTVSPNVFSTALQFKIPATTGISSGRTLQFKLWFIKGYYSSTTLTYAITQTAPISGQRTPAGTIIKSGSFALTGLTAGYQQKTLTISGLNLPLGGGTYYLYLYNGYWCSFGNQSSYKASGTLQYTPYTATTNWSISTTSLNLGSALTISVPAAGSGNESNKHTFTYSTSAGHSGTIASGVGFSTSRSWTPAVSMATAIPSGTSMSCTITCRTYASDGSTLVGSNTKSLTLTVPSSVVPTFTLGSLIANDGGRNNLFVAGISTLTAPLTSISGAQGSTVLSYSVTIGPTSGGTDWSSSGSVSGSSLSITTPTLNFALSSGSVTKRLTVTIRDSRGRSASSSRDFTYYAYAAPVITDFTAIRVGSSSSTTEDVSGNYLMVYLKTNSVTSLGGANARVSSLTYSPAVSGTDSNPSAAWGSSGYRAWFDVSSIPSSITVTYSYRDDYGSTQATRTVVSASVPIDIGFNGTGIGIGKNVESNNLIDLGLNVRARRDLQVDGSIEEKRRRTAYDLNTPGWYKICEFPSNTVALGREYLLALGRWYNYTDSEVYLINVACAYQTGTIHLVGKQVNATGFSQAALYLDSSNTISLYVYYTQSVTNGCQVDMLANSADFTLSLEPMSPAGTLLSELNLSAPAVSSRNTICQWRRRYHPDDGISEDDAITEYSFVYGGNTALGLSGPMLSIGTLGSYDTDGRGKYRMQLAGDYSSGTVFRIRTYDGDSNEWNPWRSIYTNANTIPVSNGGTGATSVASARTNLGFGKVIWAGTWSSGSISVSELTSYRLLGFDISGSSLLILGARDRDTSSSDIRAFGVVHSGGNAQADAFMLAASCSGSTLTMSDCYSVNVITGAKTTRSIYAIIGIS